MNYEYEMGVLDEWWSGVKCGWSNIDLMDQRLQHCQSLCG